jgi:Fe-S-cluster containining protein
LHIRLTRPNPAATINVMMTRMIMVGGERLFDGEVGRFVEATAIPCHRCGVCCERWQPLVSSEEAGRLAAFLGISLEDFLTAYTAPYPFDDDLRLLRREQAGCVFLGRDETGRARCTVHPARPDTCRQWTASLDRRECLDGLDRFGAGAVPLAVVYPNEAERTAFINVLRGPEGRDGA